MATGAIDSVPRTPDEEALLVRTRPPGWEYLLFGAALLRSRNELEPKWREHEAGLRRPGHTQLTERDALEHMSGVFDEARSIVDKATKSLSPASQESAFGKPGEPGDPQRIEALVATIMGGYDGLLEWSARLRAAGIPTVFRPVYDAASGLVDLPLQQFRDWIDRSVVELDRLPEALRQQKPIEIALVLTLSIDEGAQQRLQDSLDAARLNIQNETDRLEAETGRLEAETGRLEAASPTMPEITPPERLGFLASRRAKKAIDHYKAEFAKWSADRAECAARLSLAQTYQGEHKAQIILKPGEAVFAVITGASLIEDRRGPGEWQGRSSGFSVPIASVGGRSIRYRTGSSRGHFVQGAPVPTAIDSGHLYVTNQRAIFQGAKQTRECRFDKLVGFQHSPDGSTIFSVSNRQKPTTIHYGAELSGWFDFRLDLALAHYQQMLPALIRQLEEDLAATDAAKPAPPALVQ